MTTGRWLPNSYPNLFFNQKWCFRICSSTFLTQTKYPQKWKGLVDSDDWQNYLRRGKRWHEVKFWLGEYKKKNH